MFYTVSTDGNVIFSEVRTFLHEDHMATSLYVALIASSNKTIYLTGNHLIYARRSGSDKFNKM